MERRRLEVILDAVNRAEGPLRQFSGSIRRAVADVERMRREAGRGLREAGESLSLASGRASMLSRAVQFLGVSLRAPLLGIMALGVRALDVFGRILGAVVSLGRAILTWIGETAVRALQTFARAATIAGLAAMVAFTMASREAAGFEMMMRYVNTITRTTDTNLAMLSREVLDLAAKVGKAPAEVARGMYDVASAGFIGAEGLMIVGEAATAAVAGMTDVATASRVIVSTLRAYGMEAEQAGYVSDIMFKSVEVGLQTFEELAHSIGPAIATAAAAGVSIEEVAAAFGAMTQAGIDAAMSGTALQRIMLSFLDPSKEFAAALKAVGVENAAAFIQVEGLAGAVEALNAIAAGNPAVLGDIGLEMRSLRAAMSLTRGESATFTAFLAEMETAGGATAKAFDEVARTVSFAWDRMKARFSAMLIVVGGGFSDLVRQVLEGAGNIADRLAALAEQIAQSDRWQRFVATVSAAMDAAGARIEGWIEWLSENWEAIWDWVSERVSAAANQVSMGIAGILEAIRYLVASRDDIWAWAQDFLNACVAVGQGIATFVIDRLNAVIAWARQNAGKIWPLITTGAGAVAGSLFGPAGTAIGGAAGLGFGLGSRGGVADKLERSVEGLRQAVSGWTAPLLERGAGGAKFVSGTREAYLRGAAEGAAWLTGLRGRAAGAAAGGPQYGMTELAPGVWQLGEASDQLEQAGQTLDQSGASLTTAAATIGRAGGSLADAAEMLKDSAAMQRAGLSDALARVFGAMGWDKAKEQMLIRQAAGLKGGIAEARQAWLATGDVRAAQEWANRLEEFNRVRDELAESMGKRGAAGTIPLPIFSRALAAGASLQINVAEVNSKEALKRAADEAIEKFWREEVEQEAADGAFAFGQ